MRRLEVAGLSSGTSPERIAPESVTPLQCGFVLRNISRGRLLAALDQVWDGPTRDGLETISLKLATVRSRIRSEEESTGFMLISSFVFASKASYFSPPPCGEGSGVGVNIGSFACCYPPPRPSPARGEGEDQFVLATLGGVAWVMNWVASSMATPSGVGITIRNGTRMRVPATGANAISMLRCAVRYLITARSGM
jgi:hypothetical protein